MGAGVLATGILSIIFGLLCLLFPLAFAEAVIWFVAIAVIVFGIAQIISLITTRDINGRFVGILGSLIVVICGILALIWPPFVMQFIGSFACFHRGHHRHRHVAHRPQGVGMGACVRGSDPLTLAG